MYYIRYQAIFYLGQIKAAQKHSELPKYFVADYTPQYILLLINSFSKHNSSTLSNNSNILAQSEIEKKRRHNFVYQKQ